MAPGLRLTVGLDVAAVGLDRGRAGETLALVIGYELVIGEPALMDGSPLLMQVRLRPFPRSFLLGYACALLGDFRLLRALLGLFPVLAGNSLAAPAQLTLTGAYPRAAPAARKRDGQRDQDQNHNHYHDDDTC